MCTKRQYWFIISYDCVILTLLSHCDISHIFISHWRGSHQWIDISVMQWESDIYRSSYGWWFDMSFSKSDLVISQKSERSEWVISTGHEWYSIISWMNWWYHERVSEEANDKLISKVHSYNDLFMRKVCCWPRGDGGWSFTGRRW